MKIAVTAQGERWDAQVEPRFGRAAWIIIYDESTQEMEVLDNRDADAAAHGAGPKTAGRLFDRGVKLVITGNGPGGNADAVLKEGGISVVAGAEGMTVSQAYEAWKSGSLQ